MTHKFKFSLRTFLLISTILPMLFSVCWRADWIGGYFNHGDWLTINGSNPGWSVGVHVGPYFVGVAGSSRGPESFTLWKDLPPDPYYSRKIYCDYWRDK